MQLKNAYSGLKEQDIMNMTEEEMRQILLKLISCETVRTDHYYPTDMILLDDIADILRGRKFNND